MKVICINEILDDILKPKSKNEIQIELDNFIENLSNMTVESGFFKSFPDAYHFLDKK